MRAEEFEIMHREEDTHWWYVTLHEFVLDHMPQNRPAQRILDAGCGTGRLLQLLRLRGAAEGCDASDLALHYCELRGVHAYKSNLSTDSLEPSCYDVITAIDVLYHRNVINDKAVLSSFYSALKPGGRLILQVPAYDWLWSSHDDAVHTARRYTRKQLVRMARDRGFFVEKATYRVSLLFAPIAMVRLIRSIFRTGRTVSTGASDVRRHLFVVNALLTIVMKVENRLLKYLSFPFGASVFLSLRKADGISGHAMKEPL